MFTETLTQRKAIMNGISPQSLNSTRASTGGVDMSKSRRAFFTLYVGDTSGGGSISAWLQESSDNFASDVPTNDTASAFSGSGGSNVSITGQTTSSAIITFEVEQKQLTSGKQYVRLQVKETAGHATIVSCIAEGDEANQKPNSANNGTHVATNGAQKVVS
jgi:hypothetical protein